MEIITKTKVKLHVLGAGQDVGRSCIIIEHANKRVMFDCGIHLISPQKFPDFSVLPTKNLTSYINCALISHFHLDHCGALPILTEVAGYKGPIIMSYPTRSIVPLLIEDFRRISNDPKAEYTITPDMVIKCLQNVHMMQLHETYEVNGISIKTYYAGHVLGATMYFVTWDGLKIVYTGDFNTVGDRHLGTAFIDTVKPHLLLTETTYGTTVRESKRARERDFLKQVHTTIKRGGKVLIPVFALGRAQELCILLETYWGRENISAPIYFSGGLTEKANTYYRTFIGWTNEKIKSTFLKQNMFDFKHIQPFDKSMIYSASPMVLFATPGMLHGGLSLAVFKEWCTNEKNTLIIPGYCSPGTMGDILLRGAKHIEIDNKSVQVKCEILNMSFSAHADAQGLLKIINQVQPEGVVLVHGEKEKMYSFSEKIKEIVGLPVYVPENNKSVEIEVNILQKIGLSIPLHKSLKDATYLIKAMGSAYSNIAPQISLTITKSDKKIVAKETAIPPSASISCKEKLGEKVSPTNLEETINLFKTKALEAAELAAEFEKAFGVLIKPAEDSVEFTWQSEDNEIGEWVVEHWNMFIKSLT